jgi:hypothetical protein
MEDNPVEGKFFQKPGNWVSEEDGSGNLVGPQEDAGRAKAAASNNSEREYCQPAHQSNVQLLHMH